MEAEIKQITIEDQNKIFLNGLKNIIESTKGVKILDEMNINSAVPNLFFISSENKNYDDWIKQVGLAYSVKKCISRDMFNKNEFKNFPLIHMAQRLYSDFKLTKCDNLETMTLIFPNLIGFKFGSLYGYADIGMQVSMQNEPEKYYVGKNQVPSLFCIQEVPHPNHLVWLKQEKKISGYFRVENSREAERFVKLMDKEVGKSSQLRDVMSELGYKDVNLAGIYFDGASGKCNELIFNNRK